MSSENPFEELVTQLMAFFSSSNKDDLVARSLEMADLVESTNDSLMLELAIAEALNRLADADLLHS